MKATMPPRDASVAFVDYPESDGEPIGETDVHIEAITYLRQALRRVLRKRDRVYVGANMLLYYEQGEPASRRSPDVFVVKGIDAHDRRTFKTWEEAASPCFVVEVTSKGTRFEDKGSKKALYEELGVAEYLLFDPVGEYLEPRFQAFVLGKGGYRSADLAADGSFRSHELDVAFRPDGGLLRVIDLATGDAVLTSQEQSEKLEEQSARISRAEEEIERLRLELARIRRPPDDGA